MERIARILAYMTVPVVGAVVVFVALQTFWSLQRIESSVAVSSKITTDNLNSTLATTKTTLAAVAPLLKAATGAISNTSDTLNRPCLPAPCGTLPDVNRTLATIRGTVGHIETAADHEDRNLTKWDSQGDALYSKTSLLFDKTNALLTSGNASVDRFNTALASPRAALIAANVAAISTSIAGTSVEVHSIAVDVHKEADALTAPKPWYQKLGAYGTTGVNIACLVTHSCPF
jgi:hypothetical protein